jgi:HEAT repeat protein
MKARERLGHLFQRVKALEEQGDLAGLLALLDLATPVLTRRAAARSLYLIASSSVVPQLAHYLQNDPDRVIRHYLTQALGRLGDDRALEALLLALKDRDLMVREDAAAALSRYNSQAAFEALLAALQQKDDVRSWMVRRFAAEALGRLGDRRAVPALLVALRDGSDLVRPAVARALGQLGDRSAIGALKRARHSGPHRKGAECAECAAIDGALKELEAGF